MKRIAVPVEDGQLFSHFGQAREFAVFFATTDVIESEELIEAPPYEPGRLPLFLAGLGITDVIAGGIGDRAIALFASINIHVLAGVEPGNARNLAEQYLQGTLSGGRNHCDH
jgi:predicted Fe-Mo cluster-binding NifX family protein